MTLAPTIVPVETRGQMQRFLRLPRRLYRGLPGFVAPLDLERRGLVSPRSAAFFKQGRARYFLAMRGRRCVGRISAQVSPLAVLHWGDRIGMFGAIDAENDQDVVTALVEAASDWLRENGMQTMRGPFLLSPNGESGLLVQGHEEQAMLMSPWHPPYLAGLVEGAGLRKVKDLVSYEMAVGPDAEAALPGGRVRLSPGGGSLSVRGLRPDRLAEDAAIMGRLFNDAWRGNWGFVPITDDEVEAMVKELKPVLRPEHLVMVERDNEPVGFALVLPNIYDVVGDLGGSPGPAGWVRLGMRLLRHRFRSGRVILLGISASLQNTTLGAMMPSLIIAELMRRGRSMPLRTVELGWVLEDNWRMRRLIERLAPVPNKVFRVYERSTVMGLQSALQTSD